MQPIRDNSRVLTSAMLGVGIEFYDFFIYGTAAALVFGPLFFPNESPAAQTIYSFLTFGMAFVARPVGAIAFGHWGDRIGRKSSLIASMLLMGVSTFAIALLPTYAQIGWIAPALLCLMRFGQGFALGGQWGGAALMAVESAPKGWEGRFVAIMQLGSPLGVLASSGIFLALELVLGKQGVLDWGWRIPFLFSVVLVALALWMRTKVEETSVFEAALEADAPARVPVTEVLRDHPGSVLAAAAGVICTFALFYLTTAFALSEGTKVLGYDNVTFIAVQLVANCFYAAALLLAGWAADRVGPATIMARSALVAVPVGLLFGPGLHGGSLGIIAATLCFTMFVLGWVNAPQGAWMSSLFPVRLRYTGVALGFNIGGLIGGALSPLIAAKLSEAGLATYMGVMISVGGLCTWAGVTWSQKRALKQAGA